MAVNTVNVSIVQTANTFDQWRIQTNIAANDTNEIARGNFVKPAGDVTLSTGSLFLNKPSGTALTVSSDALISGQLSINNLLQANLASFTSDANTFNWRNPNSNFYANNNVFFRKVWSNNFISAVNINSSGFIETTGNYSNNNLTMNVADVLTVGDANNDFSVNVANDIVVTRNTTTGNVSVAELANIAEANIVVANVATLNVAAEDATAVMANVTIANAAIANDQVEVLNVTTRANAVLANLVTANVATLNVNAAGATARINQLTATGANVAVANVTTANLGQAVATGANVAVANVQTLNVNTAGATAAVRNLTASNIVATNTQSGVLRVTGQANAATLNVSGTANIGSLNVNTASGLVESRQFRAVGANIAVANVTTANVGSLALNDLSVATGNVSTRLNAALINVTTANVATLNVNAPGAQATIRTASIENATVSQNLSAGNVAVTQNVETGNISIASQMNAVTGNIDTLWVGSLTTETPISAPAETAAASYRLRVGSPEDDGYFGVALGTANANGNAAVSFDGATWKATANDITTSPSALLTTANIKSALATDAANIASLTLVQTAQNIANTANTVGHDATKTARVSANGADTLANVQLNFVNSPSINVSVVAGASGQAGNANIQFTANASNPELLGPQGVQGVQGVQGTDGAQGTDGFVGSDGAQGADGAQGPQGVQGVQGPQGVQGVQGVQGTDGAQGTTGAQGTDGFVGSDGAQGVQGVQGLKGDTGNTGAQGTDGAQGAQGVQGRQGTQGTQGTQGVQGRQGTQGIKGDTGTQGTQGTQGVQGRQGTQGIKGDTGSQGTQGTQGLQGVQGRQGTQGTQGPTGPGSAIAATATSAQRYLIGIDTINGTSRTASGCTSVYMSSSQVYASDFAATSDKKYKDISGNIFNALDQLKRMHGVRFYWNADARREGISNDHREQVGLIAQEIENIIPCLVYEDAKGNKSVSYSRVVPVLVEAIKELEERVAELEGR